MDRLVVKSRRFAAQLELGILWFVVGTSMAAAQNPSVNSPAENLQSRVEELEAVVRQLQADRAQAEAALPAPEGTPQGTAPINAHPGLPGEEIPPWATAPPGRGIWETPQPSETTPRPTAGWKEGFYLCSPDDRFSLKLTGQIQADYRDFLDPADTTDIDTFLVRRARLGIEATVWKFYEFRLLPDFGMSQPRLMDAYLNVHYFDSLQFEVGKFKQPFSYEQLIQDRFVPTMERSIIDHFLPARDDGLMLHGQNLFDDRLDYGFSVYNGERDGDIDTNDDKDVAGRFAVRPFNDPNWWPVLQRLQLGVSAAVGDEQEPMLPTALRTPDTVRWLQFNTGVRANGIRNRISPEISYFYGPFGFAAQYFWMEQDIAPSLSAPAVKVPFRGYYILSTLLLTGEKRTRYSEPIDPLAPFDPRCPGAQIGAWELVGRVSRLDVGDVIFDPAAQLVNPNLYSSGATEMTLGFNWYWNKWTRMQFNWEHDWFDQPVSLGSGPAGMLSSQDTLMTRFQVIF